MCSKLEIIYKEYSGLMYSKAFSILKNQSDAEDAVSDAFLRLLKNRNKIEDPYSNKTKSFAMIITENCAIDIYRKRKRLNEVELDEEIQEKVSQDIGIYDYSGENRVTEQIMRLSPKYRNILILKYVHGFDYSEIAEFLNVTETNARKIGQRAKDKLEKYCRERGLL